MGRTVNRCWPAVLLIVLVGGCAATRETTQRADRALAPGSVEGPPSAHWDTPARLLSGKSPAYPIDQFMTGRTGYAEVGFTVAADGTTRDIRVTEAEQASFGNHLAIAVRGWRFEPAMKDGQPLPSPMRYGLCFEITRNFTVPPSPRGSQRCAR